MFKNFFFSELRYALKQPMIYIFLLIMALFTFFATVSDNVVIGGSVGVVFRNAPHIITTYTTIMSIFGLLMATAFYNNAALRDHNYKFNEIIYSTPLNKFGYFFGHFFGGLVLSTVPLLGIFIGVIIGTVLAPIFGWVDPERFGSFYIETFINNYLLFILPNMFIAGTIIFALANKWKSTVISFVGTLIIIVGYIVSGTLLSDLDNETVAALTDSFGIRAYSLFAKYLTPLERNTISPGFTGILLINRLIWIAFGVVVLTISYFSFSFKEKNAKVKADKKKTKNSNKPQEVFSLPTINTNYKAKAEWAQFWSFYKINFYSIIRSVTFKILFLFSAIILFSNLIGGYEYYGLQTYPLTYKIIDTITQASAIFVIIILVFFSGELIWRDRENKINEVIDATPHTSLISLAAKMLSLISITTMLYAVFILFGALYQLANGYTRIELGLYIKDFLVSDLLTFITWSGIMVMIQVLVNNKYVGYFVSIIAVFVSSIIMSIFDIESYMLHIGASQSYTYSDINGFGPALEGSLWFQLYWILFAFISLLIAGIFWNRGNINSLKEKLQLAPKQMPKNYRYVIVGIVSCWALVAGFVYYNTQILNTYKTSDTIEEARADYEKKYKKYQSATLPKIDAVKYFIDIFPHQRKAQVKAAITLINESDVAIDSIHYAIDPKWNPKIIIPNASLVHNDSIFDYQIYKLSKALNPGEKLDIEIQTKYEAKGFENETSNLEIVENGTFFNNFDILPSLGYQSDYELSDKNKRKKYGLAPKKRMPDLDSCNIKNRMANYLTNGTADFINVETTISTSEDQIAIAPGSLTNKWNENGRNYYNYKVDHPSQNFYSFMSARYEVKTRKWNDVDIEVYYDSKHYHNVDRMIDAVERSLTYYTSQFGPYTHKQCRIIEFPRYSTFAQAFPGTMPYSESIGFIIDLEDEEGHNIVDAVISHEMAHQWWAHQLIGAQMQGATMISESFAEYSALMTMKSISNDPMKMREFLKYNHDRYLRGRSRETQKELPLYKVENQGYIHYSKGSVVLYALQDYIGEEKVNHAMQKFLEAHKYQKPPYPTSLDFMDIITPLIPDSLSYIENDWFKSITLYDNRMKDASYKKLDNGKYLISMEIEANKIMADSIGKESPLEINDWIDVGAFADSDEKKLIFEKRVKFDKPKMTLSFEIDTIPAKLAIDPKHLLIDRVFDDNIKTAEEITEEQV